MHDLSIHDCLGPICITNNTWKFPWRLIKSTNQNEGDIAMECTSDDLLRHEVEVKAESLLHLYVMKENHFCM